MFSLLLIIATCVIYYYLNLYYPRETKEKLYFTGFIITWITLVYLINFEEEFIYKLFSGIKEIQKKPRYDINYLYKQRDDNFTYP
jgi:hypothetical protein